MNQKKFEFGQAVWVVIKDCFRWRIKMGKYFSSCPNSGHVLGLVELFDFTRNLHRHDEMFHIDNLEGAKQYIYDKLNQDIMYAVKNRSEIENFPY